MDGGSGHNLMYLDTFQGLGLIQDQLQSSPHPFYRVVPGKQSIPLGWVTMSITFRDARNYHTETLAFEVVDFSGPYYIILGQPCQRLHNSTGTATRATRNLELLIEEFQSIFSF
jgi:hypothetical protein